MLIKPLVAKPFVLIKVTGCLTVCSSSLANRWTDMVSVKLHTDPGKGISTFQENRPHGA